MQRIREIRAKKERLSGFLKSSGLQAVVLGRVSNFSWLTAGGSDVVAQSSEVGPALIYYDGVNSVLVTDVIEAPRLSAEEIVGTEFEVKAFPWYYSTAATNFLRTICKGKAVASDIPLGKPFKPLPLPRNLSKRPQFYG